MHATTAIFLPGGKGRSALSNDAAKPSLLARTSSVELIGVPFELVAGRSAERLLGSQLFVERQRLALELAAGADTVDAGASERRRVCMDCHRRCSAAVHNPVDRNRG